MKTLLKERIWGLKVTMKQEKKKKKTCFGYFCRFAACALTLRPPYIYLYICFFEHSLVFAISKPLPVGFRS